MGSQYRNPGDQRSRHGANEYCNDEWKCFSQSCAHLQVPHPPTAIDTDSARNKSVWAVKNGDNKSAA
jgi:hypothetical protein